MEWYISINYFTPTHLNQAFWIIYSPVCIDLPLIIYKPYPIHATQYSILPHQICCSNYCFNQHHMDVISLLDNLNEPVSTISPTLSMFVHCCNHHNIFLNCRTKYTVFRLLEPGRNGQYHIHGRQAHLTVNDQICWSLDKVGYSQWWNLSGMCYRGHSLDFVCAQPRWCQLLPRSLVW